MNTCRRLSALLIAAVFELAIGSAVAAEPEFSTASTTRDGVKWRIGYYEGGAHDNYYDYLQATIAGLMNLGWIRSAPLPDIRNKDTRSLWNWLSDRNRSGYLEFVADGYYSANWSTRERERLRREIIDRLNGRRDLDLMIAMGTWAGKDLASDDHVTPTIVMSTSDPIQSGIIARVDDSGYDHIHARVDPRRYERQLRVFHDIIGFRRLGVAYEDSPDGRTYAAIDRVEKVAKERGFGIVRCFTQSDIADQRLAGESVIHCFEDLVGKVDAIYITQQGGVNSATIPELVRIANQHRIPTFSQLGSEEVRYGFLMSLSRPSFRPVGLFLAATMAKVLNGAKPRQLNQLFEETPNIAINLKTAELIGLYLYADVLAAADEIYRDVETPR